MTPRAICIRTTPHTSRGKYPGGSTGPGSDGVLRIATNLPDVPVEIISPIYRYRWTRPLLFTPGCTSSAKPSKPAFPSFIL